MWPPWRWRPSMRGSSGRSWLGMSPIGHAGPRRFEFDRTGEVSILDCSSEIELDGSRSDRRGMSLEKAPVHHTAKPMRPLRATVIRVSAPTAHAKTGYTAAVRSLLTKSLKSLLHSRGSPYTRFLPAADEVMSGKSAAGDSCPVRRTSADPQHDLAEHVPGGHALLRFGGIGQGEFRRDRHFELESFHRLVEPRVFVGPRERVVLHGREARARLGLGTHTLRESHPPARLQRVDAGLERIAPGERQYRIHTARGA